MNYFLLILGLSVFSESNADPIQKISELKTNEIKLQVLQPKTVIKVYKNSKLMVTHGLVGTSKTKQKVVQNGSTFCFFTVDLDLFNAHKDKTFSLETAPTIENKEKSQTVFLYFEQNTLGISCTKIKTAGEITLSDIQESLKGIVQFIKN